MSASGVSEVKAAEAQAAQAALPVNRIAPTRGLSAVNLREIWVYRDRPYFLAWRDVKVRYKQTALGAAWALLQPLFLMGIFTLLFGRVAKVPVPVPVPILLMPGSYQLEGHFQDAAAERWEPLPQLFRFDVVPTLVYGDRQPDYWAGRVAVEARAFSTHPEAADAAAVRGRTS